VTCTVLTEVAPAVRVESVNVKLETPLLDLRVLTASRNSVKCTAFTGVTCAVRGSSVNVFAKVAVTDLFAFRRTEQLVEVPLQAPLHPLKLAPDPGAAVRVTLVLMA